MFPDRREHPAFLATAATRVDRGAVEGWAELAWQAVNAGVLAPIEAQALSDLLEPRDAA